jgi:hypothetical protein
MPVAQLIHSGPIIPPLTAYAVRIAHTWKQLEGEQVLLYSVPSLGTLVGYGDILTHNHFRPAPAGAWAEQVAVTPFGHAALAMPMAAPDRRSGSPSLTRLSLPAASGLRAAPIASLQILASLRPGSTLTVVYWHNAAGQLAQQEFPVVEVGEGFLTLADAQRVINRGDSGGGAFFQGQLVGSTRGVLARVTTTGQLQPLGLFTVALVVSGGRVVEHARLGQLGGVENSS